MAAIPEWRFKVVVVCVVLLLLHEAAWQWWWWRLDSNDTSTTACSGNYIIVSNDSKTVTCQPCRICSAGMTLSPPCGSVLTLGTIIKCKTILTTLPDESKRKKSTKSKLQKFHSAGPQNENFIARLSLDVRDINDTRELQDTNLSEMADFQELFGPSSSTQDSQEMSTTPLTKYSFSNAVSRWRQRRVNPKFPTSKRNVFRPIPNSSLLKDSESWAGQFPFQNSAAPIPLPEPSNFRAGHQNINISCLLGGFLGTSLAWLLVGAALVYLWFLFSITRITHAETWNKKCTGYSRLNSSEESEQEVEDVNHANRKVDCMNGTSSFYAFGTGDLKHLKLSELPPDLEDQLVKKLDVRRKGERRYGWQKVGTTFKIPNEDLEFLELQYKRDNGSPTKELLAILGIKKEKTLSDLVNVLKSRKVKLPDVASLIRGYIKRGNKLK